MESLTLKEAIGAFYAGTEREYADKHSARHAQDVSFRLLSEFLGNDRKIREVTGSISIDMIERLRGVPKYHGKNGKNWPLEDVIASYEGEGDYETISEKTVKNHVGCWSRLWNYHLKREAVDRNIWQGHDFDTRRTRLVVRDWSDENLDKLMGKKWTFRGISRSTFAHIVGIAAYSGMRLEEICRLRPTDIAEVDGVLCFRIREHTQPEPWSPKTEAGSRFVPVHPMLKRKNFHLLERNKNSAKGGHDYIFGDLKPDGPRSCRGYLFSREFSKFKTSAGIPRNTRFHSFRHSVSTRLQNANATIRPIWIDAIMGHETAVDGRKRSVGETNYTHQIGIKNLRVTIETVRYPAAFDICHLFGD